MTLTQELRHTYHDLWHRMVTHPFVIEMGEGTLAVEKFRAYFLQDYVFVHDLVAMTSMGLAKAPTFLAANQLHQFLVGILNPENDLFVRAFTALGVSAEEYAAASASSSLPAPRIFRNSCSTKTFPFSSRRCFPAATGS